jgi:urease accessory protein
MEPSVQEEQRSPRARGVTSGGWTAELNLELALRADCTRVTKVSHVGPLRIQRPFYPEADGTSHLIILHPPGGVVGGDELKLSSVLHEGAHGLVTTPAATKIYRTLGPSSQLRQEFLVGPGALLEWLPQETIAFAGAKADIRTKVRLAAGAKFIGWELLCLGRPAAGETFERGRLVQRLELWQGDRPLYLDRLDLCANTPVLQAKWGLLAHPVVATMILAGGPSSLSPLIRECLGQLSGDPPGDLAPGTAESPLRLSASDLEGATVVRYVGPSVPECWNAFIAIWQVVRPLFSGTVATLPRIWNT